MVSKKAQLKFLAGLIIALVGAGVIFSVFFFDSQEKDDKEAELFCMSSLKLRANLVLQVGDAKITSAPLLCKTLDKKVTGEEEDIKEQLAYLMARCWKIFGEGTYEEILEADNLRNLFNIAQAGNDCFMCYSAQIDESDIDISKNEMFRYLVENEHRNMNTNYIDYFQDYGGPGNVVINDDIKGDHLYGVVFLSKNSDDKNLQWLADLASDEDIYGISNRATSSIIFDNINNIGKANCLVKDLG